MKKTYIHSFVLLSVLMGTGFFLVYPDFVSANNNGATPTGIAPVVSIGVGNGNTPANTGPVHDSTVHGSIPVFATISDSDSDLDNYHFRVIKDGGQEWHNCTDGWGLFAAENQGYASTTESKEACGFAFNQSVFTSPTGFSNTLIATLSAEELIASGGEGDYWLVLGAVDSSGNRTNSNYLEDPRVKITIANASSVASTSTPPSSTNTSGSTSTPSTPSSSSGGGGGSSSSSRTGSGVALGEICGLYMDKFIHPNSVNDIVQVAKLQMFLNKWMGANLSIDGSYGPLTQQAVNDFQEMYPEEILAPWGLTGPTGIVYQTTLRWINMLECPSLALPIPNLVIWTRNPNAPALLAPIISISTTTSTTTSVSIDGEDESGNGDSTSGFWSQIIEFFTR